MHFFVASEESRKHRRLLKKAAQLDWQDLKDIASMKGLDVLLPQPDGAAAPAEGLPGKGMTTESVSPRNACAEMDGEAVPTPTASMPSSPAL